MSLILDALNRSESDRRNPDAVPGLQSRHGPASAEAGWRRYLWPALALVFGLLALGLWLGSGGDTPAATPTLPAAPKAAVEAVAEQPPQRLPGAVALDTPAMNKPERAAPAAPEPVPAQPALDPAVAALYQQQPAPSKPAAAVSTAAASTAAASTAAASTAAASTAAAPVSVKAESRDTALDVAAMAKAARAELEARSPAAAPVVEHAAPYITDLRQSIKDQIPSIFYNEHRWASEPAERSVVLNRKRYTEGQQVKPGLRLLEILPDSIVLDFNGTEFRLQSLNSWVNL